MNRNLIAGYTFNHHFLVTRVNTLANNKYKLNNYIIFMTNSMPRFKPVKRGKGYSDTVIRQSITPQTKKKREKQTPNKGFWEPRHDQRLTLT